MGLVPSIPIPASLTHLGDKAPENNTLSKSVITEAVTRGLGGFAAWKSRQSLRVGIPRQSLRTRGLSLTHYSRLQLSTAESLDWLR